jgi:hypothetical protein
MKGYDEFRGVRTKLDFDPAGKEFVLITARLPQPFSQNETVQTAQQLCPQWQPPKTAIGTDT